MSLIQSILKSISSFVLGRVYETTDYDNIHFIKGNRATTDKKSEAHIQELASSMRAEGWLMTSVCLMVIIMNKLFVIAGQHRVKAATRAGVPVRFMVVGKYDKHDQDTIDRILGAIQKDSADHMGWDTAAYLHSFCEKGNKQYLELRAWMKKNDIENIELSLILLGKDNSSRALADFRSGCFEMGDTAVAEDRISKIREIATMGQGKKFSFVFNRNFVRAFCSVLSLDAYDHKEFVRMLGMPKTNSMFVKQVDITSYKKMMQEIFNWKKELKNKRLFF